MLQLAFDDVGADERSLAPRAEAAEGAGVRRLTGTLGAAPGLVLVGIACSLALAVALAVERDRERSTGGLSWLPFLGAVCLFSLGPLAGGTSFWLILRDLAPSAASAPSLWVWERSFAARYIPSGALTVAVRMVERERLGASRAQMLSATAYEQVVAAAAAAAVSLAAFSLAGRKPPLVAVVVLSSFSLSRFRRSRLATWWSRRRSAASRASLVVVRTRALLAATRAVRLQLARRRSRSVDLRRIARRPADTPAFAFLLGAYTFAWLVGFVVPFAPSGLGVREATLIALLAPVVGAAPATALTVGLRLANVAGDFLAIGAIEAGALVLRQRGRLRQLASRRGGDAVTLAVVIVLFTGLCVLVEVLARRVRSRPSCVRKLAHMSSAMLRRLPPARRLVRGDRPPRDRVRGADGRLAPLPRLQRDPRRVADDVRRGLLPARHRRRSRSRARASCRSPTASSSSVSATDSQRSWAGASAGGSVPLIQTRKTLWGSGAFLAASFALGVLVLAPTGVSLSYALVAAAAMAVALTPVELFLTYGLDNLLLPTIAGLLLTGL